MSKAVLVMDMPSSCMECLFCRGLNVCRLKQCLEKDGVLSVFTVDNQILNNSKPDWCPLRELPKKKPTIGKESDNDILYMNAGYNACIDELLKGEAE